MTTITVGTWWKGLAIAAIAVGAAYGDADAQGRKGKDRGHPEAAVDVTFHVDVGIERQIRAFYAERTASGVEALPPGIRRRLARGKPLPPGIAKRMAPPELVSALSLPRGYEVVEVGLDVFIVEAATAVVHDILTDVIH